jgi:diacylglycerol kinase family enzyme
VLKRSFRVAAKAALQYPRISPLLFEACMQTLGIYMNHRASQAKGSDWNEQLKRSFFRSNLNFHRLENLEQLNDSLDQDIQKNVDGVVCIGGDGTINQLIQKLAYKDVGLLVVPAGTANDLALELGNRPNISKLSQTINNDEYKYIDLIKINGRLMATNGGFGLGSEVAERINRARKRIPFFKELMKLTGKKIYSFFLPTELMSIKFERYSLSIESEQFSGEVQAAAILINNQATLAGTFKVAPFTKNDDGMFNVTILKHSSRLKFIQTIAALAVGYYPASDSDFITFETRQLSMKLNDPSKSLKFFGDGEVFDQETREWNISIEPQALKVYSRVNEKSLLNVNNEVHLS